MFQKESLIAVRHNYDCLSRWYDWFSSGEGRIIKLGLRLLDVQPGEKVLEIGFGTGHALLDLANATGKAGTVDGIDISPGMLSKAFRRVKHSGLSRIITLRLGDATHLPYPDHQFQVAFMSFTLELFGPNLVPVVLAECRRVLQHGGRLGIVSLVKKDNRAVDIYEWLHFHFPNVVDCRPIFIRTVLEKAGFEVAQAVGKKLWGLPVEAVAAKEP
jgi:ubiquinone/menaquinone biosynthesis C-methylase UbiE